MINYARQRRTMAWRSFDIYVAATQSKLWLVEVHSGDWEHSTCIYVFPERVYVQTYSGNRIENMHVCEETKNVPIGQKRKLR